MKIKLIKPLSFLTLIIAAFSAVGQVVAPAQELTIGDKVPDLEFDTIINSSKTKVKLSDFRGKLVILDLWTTSCGSCIADFPRKQKVQEDFKNEVVILPVTFFKANLDDSTIKKWKQLDIPKFWSSNPITQSLSFPTAIDAKSLLVNNFPVVGPGLQIWIDKKGILRGLTTDEYVNPVEIKKVLNEEKTEWAIWKRLKFDETKTLLAISNSELSLSKIKYSVYYPHLDYVNNFIYFKSDTSLGVKRFTSVNSTLISLFLYALELRNTITPYENRIIFKIKDSAKFFKNDYYEDWWKENSYCYEKVSSVYVQDSVFGREMLDDLQKYYGIKASIEIVKRKCKILKSIKSRLSNDENDRIKKETTYSYSLKEFLHDLNSNSFKTPIVIDNQMKKEFKREIYMRPINWNNWGQVERMVKLNQLKLEEEYREIPMIIISDKTF